MKQITPPPPPPSPCGIAQLKRLTALAAALVALALAAGTAEARCTAGDVTMTKVFPAGNLGRFVPNNQAIIRFALPLPSNCPITDPPLEVCVVIWDNSPCDHDADSTNQCDGEYVGGAGVMTGAVWKTKGRAQFCSATLLSESVIPGVPVTLDTLLISTSLGNIQKARSEGLQGHLSLIMYNPVRSLVIPISND